MCTLRINNTNLTDPKYQEILDNIKEIRYNVENAKAKYRSSNDSVEIMAVTKTVDPEKINFAVKNGFRLLGENRVQEYLSKKDFYDKSAEVQFIGHLQTNKVKYIINDVTLIQSVDSVRLASEINRLSKKNNKVTDILLEVNIGAELSKSGVDSDGLYRLTEEISHFENIRIRGLMAIPPIGAEEKLFAQMNEHFHTIGNKKLDNVSMDILSMGMSGDYELAIKHGSNLVRIGTKLFGARNYNTKGN